MSTLRARALRFALAGCAGAARTLAAQQEVPADRVQLADAVRADLAKLSDLERAQFSANKRYTADIKALNFTPASGATISITYASARTFSASASHPHLAPFLCFVIVSSTGASSPAEKPFCTDSRYVTAATALARVGTEIDSARAAAAQPPAQPAPKPSVMPVTVASAAPKTPESAIETQITPAQFSERLKAATGAKGDSVIVVVQFAVKDARYDPSRGVLEVAIERVPLPPTVAPAPNTRAARPALECFTRPAFVCGESDLTYIARDILHVSRADAPSPEVVRSGLTLQARFAVGHRDDTAGPTLTLLALVLQAKGEVVSRWEPTTKH